MHKIQCKQPHKNNVAYLLVDGVHMAREMGLLAERHGAHLAAKRLLQNGIIRNGFQLFETAFAQCSGLKTMISRSMSSNTQPNSSTEQNQGTLNYVHASH